MLISMLLKKSFFPILVTHFAAQWKTEDLDSWLEILAHIKGGNHFCETQVFCPNCVLYNYYFLNAQNRTFPQKQGTSDLMYTLLLSL